MRVFEEIRESNICPKTSNKITQTTLTRCYLTPPFPEKKPAQKASLSDLGLEIQSISRNPSIVPIIAIVTALSVRRIAIAIRHFRLKEVQHNGEVLQLAVRKIIDSINYFSSRIIMTKYKQNCITMLRNYSSVGYHLVRR